MWRADNLGAAELLRGRFAGYAYDLHTHDKACFALLVRGAIRIRMRGCEFTARAGDLYAIDADEPHAGWPVDNDGWSLRTLYVDMKALHGLLHERAVTVGTPTILGPIIRDPGMAALFHQVHACSERPEPGLEGEQRYLNFVEQLFSQYTLDASVQQFLHNREERAIRLARDFLDHHLDQKVHLTDIAAVAGLPPFRLLRAFERAMGMSPHSYQRQARIRFATGLIRFGHPLREVAAAAGFSDQAHLTRSFKRSLGVTPGAYRQAICG